MFQRLLLGIDDSPASDIAISFATALAGQHSAVVRVLHINQFLVGGRGHTVLTTLEAERLVDAAVEELQGYGVPASGEVLRATCFNVAPRLVEAAQQWSADAIVVGSRRRRRASWRAAQGVRERVIQLSALPVVTAPAPLKVAGNRIQPVTVAPSPLPISRGD